MGLLKPVFLQNATSAADVQKLMKADLKNSVGKKNLKFIAAKNCLIGGKTIPLFIITDTPALFETVLKTKYPKAYRAKGTCDVVKDTHSGTTQVAIKSSAGQMLPDAVVKLMPEVVAHDKSFVASIVKPTDKLGDKPVLKVVAKPTAGGLSELDKEEYRAGAKQTVMASMTPDGKIGSVYLGKEGRIRTTHGSSPSQEKHEGTTIVQFNIDETKALPAFKQAHPDQYASPKKWAFFDVWLKDSLKDVTKNNVPAWATLIEGPSTAHDLTKSAPPDDLKLFEIFKDINDDVETWHPSRGTGTKFETDQQTISVLKAAIKHIDTKYPKPEDHDSQDPAIIRRQQQIVEAVRTRRATPRRQDLEFFWKDPIVAQRMKTLRLKTPSIAQLDSDQTISDRITEIFQGYLEKTLATDGALKDRLTAIQNTRKLRNKAFYDFVKSRLPNSAIANAMREPKDV